MLEIILLTYTLAILSGILIGSVSTPLIMSRSVTFGLTMLHSILGGAILGVFLKIIFSIDVPIPLIATITAIAFSIIAAELIERGFTEDTATAFSVSTATTLTIIFSFYASSLSSTAVSEAWSYVMGSSSLATPEDIFKVFIAIILVVPMVHLLSKEFLYIAFDEEGSKAMGLNVRFYRYTFYSLVALTSATLASTIGVLVTHVVLATPGALSIRMSKKRYAFLSYFIAIAMMLAGYLLARVLNVPPSGGVGLVSTILILLMVIIREYGHS